jgi:hypothetical protein
VVGAHALVVCFTAVLTFLVAGSVALYGVFQAAAPGVAGVNDRGNAAAALVRGAYVALAAGAIFLWHWRRSAGASPRVVITPGATLPGGGTGGGAEDVADAGADPWDDLFRP